MSVLNGGCNIPAIEKLTDREKAIIKACHTEACNMSSDDCDMDCGECEDRFVLSLMMNKCFREAFGLLTVPMKAQNINHTEIGGNEITTVTCPVCMEIIRTAKRSSVVCPDCGQVLEF